MVNANVKTVLGYCRVSTAEQGDSGAGIEAQRRAIEAEARRRGWVLLDVVEDVASGKSLRRPGIRSALDRLAAGEADGLICANLDRLTRDVGDFAHVIKLSAKQDWALRLLDLDIDTSTSTGKLNANIVATFAQFERDRIGDRTRAGLAVRRSEGVRFGRPPLGRSDDLSRRIARQRRAGWTWQKIADKLNRDGVPTLRGSKEWRPSTVRAVTLRVDRRRAR